MLNNSILNDLSLYGEEFMFGHGKTAASLSMAFAADRSRCGNLQNICVSGVLPRWGYFGWDTAEIRVDLQ